MNSLGTRHLLRHKLQTKYRFLRSRSTGDLLRGMRSVNSVTSSLQILLEEQMLYGIPKYGKVSRWRRAPDGFESGDSSTTRLTTSRGCHHPTGRHPGLSNPPWRNCGTAEESGSPLPSCQLLN
ncbi:mCG140896 [Mus musculus]|nr:mCG140896 [Mus musculus]